MFSVSELSKRKKIIILLAVIILSAIFWFGQNFFKDNQTEVRSGIIGTWRSEGLAPIGGGVRQICYMTMERMEDVKTHEFLVLCSFRFAYYSPSTGIAEFIPAEPLPVVVENDSLIAISLSPENIQRDIIGVWERNARTIKINEFDFIYLDNVIRSEEELTRILKADFEKSAGRRGVILKK